MTEQAHEDVAQILCGRRAWKLDHGEAVAKLAERSAIAIGLTSSQASRVRLAACLHDIGKTLIDERVLRMPGPLSVDDWAQIRLHPILGEQMLIGEGLGDIAPWVRAHHERFDGLGYPDGAAGIEIPLEARIISVADAYDAMISERPYSEAIAPADACEELLREAGTQFDPGVVAAFLRCLRGDGDPALTAVATGAQLSPA